MTIRLAGEAAIFSTFTRWSSPTLALTRVTPSICSEPLPRLSAKAGIALATVGRSPVMARMLPTVAPRRPRSLGSSRAMPRPTSLPSASATRSDSSPAAASIFFSAAMTALLQLAPGVGPERQVVDQVADVEFPCQKLVDFVEEAEEEDPRFTLF